MESFKTSLQAPIVLMHWGQNLCHNPAVNPFKFSHGDDGWSPPYANPSRVQWGFPRRARKWRWPADFRSSMSWLFALTVLASLVNIVRATLHPGSRTLVQNMLHGPIFYCVFAILCGVALWALWKDKSWARLWAVAAGAMYFLDFVKQFMIPVRPAWDHYLSSLIAAVVGMLAFSWPDKTSGRSLL